MQPFDGRRELKDKETINEKTIEDERPDPKTRNKF